MKRFKKLALLVTIAMTATLFFGCAGEKSPTEVVELYFDEIKSGSSDVSKLFAISEDEISEDAEEISISGETEELLLEKMKKIDYTVNSEEINGETATVNVTVDGVDFNVVMANVMQEAMGFILAQAFSGEEMTEEETDQYLEEITVKYLEEVTYSEKTGDIQMSKVDDEWKIDESPELSILLIGINEEFFEDIE